MEDESSPSSHLSASDIQVAKKRRLHGACDICRRKKIKSQTGDSAEMPGNLCSNCIAAKVTCTHDMPRHPKKKKESQQAYIHDLEDRLDRLERVLQNLHPDQTVDNLLDPGVELYGGTSSESAAASPSTYSELQTSLRKANPDSPFDKAASPPPTSMDDPSEAEDLAHIDLAEHLGHLSIRDMDSRFFGQSSAFMFVKHATSVKSETTGVDSRPTGQNFRRPLYWELRPWEKLLAQSNQANYIYPENDLLLDLVAIYFEKSNSFLPLLHRPTFERALYAGPHTWDPGFGMTVLMVCAVASRYSHDPRVLMPDDDSGLSCGWKYFSQIPIFRNTLISDATIYDLQYYCLAIIYLLGTAVPQLAWNLVGLGLRFALEKGAHRRKGQLTKPTAEEELMKRAFWCLVCVDRLMSSFLGRPSAIQDEDFDVDYPVECDDEYWETENIDHAFKQPAGKPSVITGFVAHLKLCEILAFTLRTLYSTKKSKIMLGLIGNEWEQRIVAQLDSSMNEWKDTLPPHLQWDPDMKNQIFFHQSVFLHATYYYLQIQIHRPFLTKDSALRFPSLAVCSNSARSCSHLLEAAVSRGLRVLPNIMAAAFASGIVLLLNVWGNNQTGSKEDPAKEMAHVRRCANVLKACENRWHVAGRFTDLLNEIGSFSEQPRPAIPKRRRDSTSEGASKFQYANPAYMPPASQYSSAASSFTDLKSMYNVAKPAGGIPSVGNNWELSNLLLVEMGYIQPTEAAEQMHVPIFPMAAADPLYRDNFETTQDIKTATQEYPSIASPPEASGDDMLSLWLEAPAAFSADEWDLYISKFGYNEGIDKRMNEEYIL